ncbi:MAG: large-conductance mechanosensitive channel protein MscL [Candidatus Methylacidiphilales bacterium]
MGILNEFKTFISRGNVIDLAVGVIVGAAFGKIISSFVDNVIAPVLGLILGRLDLSDLAWVIAEEGGEPVLLRYGAFLQTCIDFVITAAAIFFMIKAINTARQLAKKKEDAAAPAPPPEPSAQEKLLAEIRDLLKQTRA